ncbi:hypothetical protein D9M71_725890 [compost metagenome]
MKYTVWCESWPSWAREDESFSRKRRVSSQPAAAILLPLSDCRPSISSCRKSRVSWVNVCSLILRVAPLASRLETHSVSNFA